MKIINELSVGGDYNLEHKGDSAEWHLGCIPCPPKKRIIYG
jgi:hypothetical protein